VCLATAAAAALWWLPALHRESALMRAAADAAELRNARQADQRRSTTEPFSAARRFRAAFPPASDRQDRLATILAVAAEHQLVPRRSDFQLSPDRDLGLLRYSVTMPLSGSYEQVREFIEAALSRDTALSLDRLRLRRPSAGAVMIETDLTWSFYMRADAPSAAPTSVPGPSSVASGSR
jgi:hypothetical protein